MIGAVIAPQPRHPERRWAVRLLLATVLTVYVAGCSTLTSDRDGFYSKNEVWSGRLSLRTLGDAPENWVASFVLRGKAEAGDLTLLSPLGSTLAQARWSPGAAVLDQGNSIQTYPNMDALTTAISGNPLPVAAMFSWLAGQPISMGGWTPQLERIERGRIQARRDWPAPGAEIRIILDQPAD